MKVILDTDPGIDDALAFILLKAMPEIELQAITVTHGNTSVEKCTTNALKLVELLGMQEIPVAMGADQPLVKALSVAEETHGDTGLGHAVLPSPTTTVVTNNAANLIIEIVNANPGEITILCIGPVTNLALALLKEPSLRKKLGTLCQWQEQFTTLEMPHHHLNIMFSAIPKVLTFFCALELI